MRKALLLIAILCPVSSWAAVALVSPCIVGSWTTGTTFTTSITATTGNLLTVNAKLVGGNGTILIASVADGTNTYTAIDTVVHNESGTNFVLNNYYAKNITGGALTITVTLDQNIGGNTAEAQVCEFSGASTSAPLEKHTAQFIPTPGFGANDVTSGPVTTTVNGEAIFSGFVSTGGEVWTLGTGYSAVAANSANLFFDEYQIQSSAGLIAGTAMAQFGNLHNFLANVATFQAAAATTRGKIIGGRVSF